MNKYEWPMYLLAWFSDDPTSPNLRYITEQGMGAEEAYEGKWFTPREMVDKLKVDPDLFIIIIPKCTVECGSFT